MAISAREARQAYPQVPTLTFVRIYEANQSEELTLLEELEKAETAAQEAAKGEASAMLAVRERLTASEHHHLLNIMVPDGIDREHTQAILMYGFLMPGNHRVFIGGKVLPERHVRENTDNKLGQRFSRDKYEKALAFLKRDGILNYHRLSGEQYDGLSLKARCDSMPQILHAALEYALAKRQQ